VLTDFSQEFASVFTSAAIFLSLSLPITFNNNRQHIRANKHYRTW